MATKKYVVIHGSVKTGTGAAAEKKDRFESFDADEAAAAKMDPSCIMLADEWEIAKKEAAAREELEAKRKAMGNSKPLPVTLEEALNGWKMKLQAERDRAETEKDIAAKAEKAKRESK